jgi:predicted RNase H-like nuclease (RuvC/YqgF family)
MDGDIALKVEVGVLKEKVSALTDICEKLDRIIEKLADNNSDMVNQIYKDMDKRKEDTVSDIKELHSRITTTDRNLSDKIELTERRIMEEFKALREHITEHNKKEDEELEALARWKWMVAGGVVVVAWIISNIRLEYLAKLFN